MATKHCGGCDRDLPTSEFYKNRARKDGLQTRCKTCELAHRKENSEAIRERQRVWRERNREAILEQNKHRYERNRETILEKNKAYREENRESIRDWKKAYVQQNREAIRERQKAYEERNREALQEWRKSYYEQNRETIRERAAAYREKTREEKRRTDRAKYVPSPGWETLKQETHKVYGYRLTEEIAPSGDEFGYIGIAAEKRYDKRHSEHRTEQRAWEAVSHGDATERQHKDARDKPFGWLGSWTEPEPELLALAQDREMAEWTERFAIRAFSTPFNRRDNAEVFDLWSSWLSMTSRM